MTSHEDSVEARFRKDIAEHQMTVHYASDAHRHLTFRRPGTFAYGFHVTTWPGYLCISGDVGSFVFSRLPDMFEFFRGSRINSGYWAEKLTAHDKYSGHRVFSEDVYRKAIENDFSHWEFDNDEDRKRAWEAIEDDWSGLFGASTTGEAVKAAMDWECPISKQRFTDFWDHTLEEYSFQFLWCCYAIQWAIARFDETAVAASEPAAA